MTEPVHECVKPLSVARRFDADRHGRPQRAVEPLHRIALVGQLLVDDFTGARVENSHLLLARVQITADECHDSGPLLGSRVTVPPPNPINSRRPF